jgi:hypothetical protein
LDATTVTRIASPTSAPVSVYVAAVAPSRSTQLLSARSQRPHWYAYEIVGVPDQDPADAVNV